MSDETNQQSEGRVLGTGAAGNIDEDSVGDKAPVIVDDQLESTPFVPPRDEEAEEINQAVGQQVNDDLNRDGEEG
jgi:hypothetical protein